MGCNLSRHADDNPPSAPRTQLKFDKFRKGLQTAVDAEAAAERTKFLEQRCAEMEAELSEKMQELQFLKAEDPAPRNSLKLSRKLTYHDGSLAETALRETRAMVISLEDENGRLKSQLLEQPSSEALQTEEALDLQLELDELRSDLSKLTAYNQKLLKEKVLLMFCSSLNINLLLAVSFWKRGIVAPARSDYEPSFDIEKVNNDKEEMLRTSPILQTIGKIDSDNVRSMSRTSVILLFENLMDEKFEQDLRDLSLGRPLKPVSEFLFEYMTRRHGLAAMATKKMAQFAVGLISMYAAGNQYARVMCGLFNIVKQEEMHPNFQIFLTHARAVFQALKDKRRRPTERQRSASQTSQRTDFRKEKFENIDAGGSAPLVFVCDLLYSLFKDFPASGELMMRLVKPPDLSIEDFIIFKICHKMAQDGCSPEELFKRLDRDRGGTIDREEFHNGIQQLMGLWLCGEDLQLAMDKLTPNGAEIPRDQFFKYINFDSYYNGAAWKSQSVAGANFLMAFATLHQSVQEECLAALRKASDKEEVGFVDFQRALASFDPILTHQDAVRIYNSAGVDKVDAQTFLAICQNEYLGRFKSFSTFHTDYRLLDTEPRKPDLQRSDCDTPKARDKKKGSAFRFNP